MTENEAIERIRSGICNEIGTQRFCKDSCMHGIDKCAYSMAIQALKEIQQYRAIGTIEKFAEAMKNICKNHSVAIDRYTNELIYAHEDGTWHSLIDEIADETIDIVRKGGVE